MEDFARPAINQNCIVTRWDIGNLKRSVVTAKPHLSCRIPNASASVAWSQHLDCKSQSVAHLRRSWRQVNNSPVDPVYRGLLHKYIDGRNLVVGFYRYQGRLTQAGHTRVIDSYVRSFRWFFVGFEGRSSARK